MGCLAPAAGRGRRGRRRTPRKRPCRAVPAERLGALRHVRQRRRMVLRLVRPEGVFRSRDGGRGPGQTRPGQRRLHALPSVRRGHLDDRNGVPRDPGRRLGDGAEETAFGVPLFHAAERKRHGGRVPACSGA